MNTASRLRAFTIVCLLATFALAAQTVHAQSAQLNLRTLRGVVTDTLGKPLADVDVVLLQLRRQVRTRVDGTFRFDSVRTGSYDVNARRIGYVARSHRVVVNDSGGYVAIQMIGIGTVLSSVVTTAERGGVSGIIADTSFKPLMNAEVTVVGAGQRTKTDAAGAFFLPLKTGQYMLRIERDGYTRQMMGVTIPENEGRMITAWLAPRSGPENHRQAQGLFDLGQRMIRVPASSARFFTREALAKDGITDLWELARRRANGRVSVDCLVKIGGESDNISLPLGVLSTSEIEFVEVYSETLRSRGGRSRTSTFSTPAASASCGNQAIIVWLRQ